VTTPAGTDAVCPRCGRRFHCGACDAAPCACTTVRLDDATLAALRERWSACLCRECLVALAGGEPIERPAS
jgi:hypothetical protein